MRELVVDASVIVKWFRSEGEQQVKEARALRTAYEAGELILSAPPLLLLELINLAGRRWRWAERELVALASRLGRLELRLLEPELDRVARWTSRGLTAYDAAYVAAAEAAGVPLITSDPLILGVATGVARPLSGWR